MDEVRRLSEVVLDSLDEERDSSGLARHAYRGRTKEVSSAALTGDGMPPMDNALAEHRTPSAMLARMEKADAAFHSVLKDVRNRSAWEDTFVDALCEPPETFTLGGMFAHVIIFNAHRRTLAIDAVRRLGVKVEGFGCPEEYVTSLATA